jgi:hypothetical protein
MREAEDGCEAAIHGMQCVCTVQFMSLGLLKRQQLYFWQFFPVNAEIYVKALQFTSYMFYNNDINQRSGLDSRHYQKKKVVGLERGPLGLVSTTEELLDRKVAAPV